MSFYEQLGSVYDDVFPENPAIASFLAEGLTPNSRVLDLACGTGTYSCALAKQGHNVTGIDLDSGMIEQAKVKGQGLSTRFSAGDMTAFETVTGGENFERIYCVGNSIPHLKDRDTVQAFCNKAYENLNGGGDFIVQTVNFRRVLSGHMDALPAIEKTEKSLRFVRSYEVDAGSGAVSFNGELAMGNESWRDSVRLLTLDRDEMHSMFTAAGFQTIEIYGGYNAAAFTDESPALVIKAEKSSKL